MSTIRYFDNCSDSIAIVGVPEYGGEVPALAAKRFQRLKANGMPVIPGVVYGNRAFEDTVVTDSSRCILCCACIKGCPEQAWWVGVERINKISHWLHENCADRKEPEVYIQ